MLTENTTILTNAPHTEDGTVLELTEPLIRAVGEHKIQTQLPRLASDIYTSLYLANLADVDRTHQHLFRVNDPADVLIAAANLSRAQRRYADAWRNHVEEEDVMIVTTVYRHYLDHLVTLLPRSSYWLPKTVNTTKDTGDENGEPYYVFTFSERETPREETMAELMNNLEKTDFFADPVPEALIK